MDIPTTVSFEEAIAHTHQLMDAMQQGVLTDAETEHTLSQLVSTENGARGFFVTYLTDDRPLADQPSKAVLTSLKSSPEVVSELLVKNLAMASAMAVAHRRNNNEAMAQGSDRVRTRTLNLVQQLQLPQIATKLQQLSESAATGKGTYQAFLDRWNYDAEQRQVIQAAVREVK